jgi:hypothetical protein
MNFLLTCPKLTHICALHACCGLMLVNLNRYYWFLVSAIMSWFEAIEYGVRICCVAAARLAVINSGGDNDECATFS